MSAKRARARAHKRITQQFHFLSARWLNKKFCEAQFDVSMDANARSFYTEFYCSLSALLSKCNLHIILCSTLSKGRSGKFRFVFGAWVGRKGKSSNFYALFGARIVFGDTLICALASFTKMAFVANLSHCARVGCEVGVVDQASKVAAIMEEIYIWKCDLCVLAPHAAALCSRWGVARRRKFCSRSKRLSPLDRDDAFGTAVMSRTCTRTAHRLLTETHSSKMRRERSFKWRRKWHYLPPVRNLILRVIRHHFDTN
jgi:hypothetical protein